MKKYILSLCLVCVLFCCAPIVVKGATQEELTQQLITTLTQMIAQLQEQIKVILDQQATQTSVSQNQSEKTDSTTTITINTEISNSKLQDQRKVAMEELLQNPTLESYKTFCNKAKGLQGFDTKEELNSDKTKIITVQETLYDELDYCKTLDGAKKFIVYTLPDNGLSIPFESNDTDLEREAKIRYNDALTEVSQKSKFIIFIFLSEKQYTPNYDVVSNIKSSINDLDKFSKQPNQQTQIANFIKNIFPFTDPMYQIRNLVKDDELWEYLANLK